MQGLVFNSHWLSYFDEASLRFFESVGHTPLRPLEGFEASVVHAVLDWKGPAGLDDVIQIDVDATRLGRSSFDLRYTASVGEREVCVATITYVSVDAAARKSRPIPDGVRAALVTKP